MNWKRALALAIVAGAVLSVVGALALRGGGTHYGPFIRTGRVGVVYIEGTIVSGRGGDTLTSTSVGSDEVVGYLRDALSDSSIRAVVLRLNSPGGSAAGSQEIAGEVARLQEAGKKVVASMGDVAASGAYLVASAADLVMADPGTITGSIGVIMEISNLEALLGKLGISVKTIKSGEHKDLGSSTRPLTEEEQALLQEMVDDVHRQFVAAVVEGRGLSRARVEELADGRIFTGRQAVELGLVDSLGNLHDALDEAARLAGLGEEYGVREYGEVSPLSWFLERIGGAALAAGLVPLDGRWRGPAVPALELLKMPWPDR
ncbi:MAG: signal peptide peptidase SppA [Acetobacteraceae bacterium]|nr:signal peptide peptidase SppA [Acetobacteraceae bacterium]